MIVSDPSITTKVLSVVQGAAEPHESFIRRVLAAAELVMASEVAEARAERDDLRGERDRYAKWSADACRQLGDAGVTLMSPPRLPEAVDEATRVLRDLRAERDRLKAELGKQTASTFARASERDGLKAEKERLMEELNTSQLETIEFQDQRDALLEAIALHRKWTIGDAALYAKAEEIKRGESR